MVHPDRVHADIVIVGGGLCGVAVAEALATAQVGSVLLLEQCEQLGSEASAQNAGMVRRLALDSVERDLACRSAETMATLPFLEATRVTGAVLACGGESPRHHSAVEDLRNRGVVVDPIAPRDLESLAPALGGAPVAQAWHLPEETVADAWALVTALWRRAEDAGARRLRSCRVERVDIEGGRVAGLHTSAGFVETPLVVLATAAWSRGLAASLGLDRPLFPLARHLLLTTAHSLSHPDHPWCWIDDIGVYARPEGGGWLCSPCDESLRLPGPGPGSRGPAEPMGYARAQDLLERWFPALDPMRFSAGWTGLRTFTPDRRPLVGSDPDVPGLWWATGFGGFGVTCSMAIGPLFRGLLLREPIDWVDAGAMSVGRPFPQWDLPREAREGGTPASARHGADISRSGTALAP